ncbi:cytochrome-c peroxidase [Sulfurovum sp. bin170]|uniref:cytochrome-c peroxidase n=1 Tax=Sulfurovum sp. bin170 TaxID=2695268 RepID=UPI0013E08B21|nr:cytochrome-c peroxidase [Sulfurovum sp. bin170]NEW61334.1 cytochrome-c peroxidase [Sulfurovum sp. bin170]
MKSYKLLATSLVATSLLFGATSTLDTAKKSGLVAIPESKADLSKLIDPDKTITDERVELGKKLFFEPRLSKSGIISCNTCHNLGLGGADGVSAAVGHKWTANPHHLNSPTVYNAVFFKAQFWDGRSPHLEDQAQGPMQAGPEMASPKELVEKRINSIPEYVAEFQKAYGKDVKIDFEKITATIGIFERTLVTPSRFDDFLNGKKDALSVAEQKGLETFIAKGCTSCHNGIALGGTMQPFELAGKYKFADVGDFKGDAKGMVKTPTLRNITETAPYFHNGAIWNLSDAVKEMGSTQLGIKITDAETDEIVTFLKALKGRKPEVTYPQLPESTMTTPQPDFK